MKNRIITISREFGSGGRTVGKQAAQKLSIPCYDQELIEKIAEESGFAPAYIKEQGEYVVRAGWLSNALAGRFSNGLTTQDQLWLLQRKVILELAEKGLWRKHGYRKAGRHTGSIISCRATISCGRRRTA